MESRVIGRWVVTIAIIASFPCSSAVGGWKEDIGLTDLLNYLGSSAPNGTGIHVSQIEAPIGTNYVPNPTDPELAGKTFILNSGPSEASWHATTVAKNFYGTATGVAPGINSISCYEAGNYLGSGFLKTGNSFAPPAIETNHIQNHSWIGESSYAQEAVRRFDYAISRDGFIGVVGLNNYATNPVPGLMAHTYNGITVGQSSGDHSRGGTTFDGVGRIKPDLVSPSAYGGVSHSVAVVSGAAALLLQTATANPAFSNAQKPEVMKAILMAGATKQEFPSWSRTHTSPLDPVYGAGELNVYNSYLILTAGEQTASPNSMVSTTGWDYNSIGNNPVVYFFEIQEGYTLNDFSVVLTWQRNVYDAQPGPQYNFQYTVANMSLQLYTAINYQLDSEIDWSDSPVDNVEHIYATQLTPGQYALVIRSDTANQPYGIAWQGWLVPEPSYVFLGTLAITLAIFATRTK
jgi:hypothetical protein